MRRCRTKAGSSRTPTAGHASSTLYRSLEATTNRSSGHALMISPDSDFSNTRNAWHKPARGHNAEDRVIRGPVCGWVGVSATIGSWARFECCRPSASGQRCSSAFCLREGRVDVAVMLIDLYDSIAGISVGFLMPPPSQHSTILARRSTVSGYPRSDSAPRSVDVDYRAGATCDAGLARERSNESRAQRSRAFL